jgi:hypothetical protein
VGFPRHQQLNGPSRWRLLVGNGIEKSQRCENGTHWARRGRGAFGAQPWLKYESARFILAVAAAARLRGAERRGGRSQGGEEMVTDPRLMRLAARLACVALVVSIMFPLGRMVFPYVAEELGTMQFSALEAVLSTTVGFGIYTAFFG